MTEAKIIKASSFQDYARCVQLRTRVFVIGQNVPPDREVDQYEDDCSHYLAALNGVPVGTVRWRRYGQGGAKIERLAVLEEARGMKIGAQLMAYALGDIATVSDIEHVKLGSQDHAVPFYTALGFQIDGDGFEDAGIPHHNMVKRVRP
jgi:predicted GNAT family N-acyltransferase